MTRVRVPASSANLGPGFDALGMALDLHAELGVAVDGGDLPDRARVVDERHPAGVAFRRGGGRGDLWVHSPIPSGRGLGFSGAMRVGGLVVAVAQQSGPDAVEATRPALFDLAVELEGHADNVAASLYGGVVATAAGRVVRVPLGLDPAVLAWVPPYETVTRRSRGALAATVSFHDAVFNVGRTALLVAALAAGDVEALRWATADRLHQDRRFASAASSHAALADGLDAGAWCGWLSGSGPSVCLLCDPADAAVIAAALPADGRTEQLRIEPVGCTVVGST
ncbi:MAG: homoserine kinase [Ilumatobacteraceae bacterium]